MLPLLLSISALCLATLSLVCLYFQCGRIEALEHGIRAARRDLTLLTKASAYDREQLNAALRHIDTLADHVAALEGTPEERAVAFLSKPPEW